MLLFLKKACFSLVLLVLISACKKESNNPAPNQNVYVKASVDGKSFLTEGTPSPNQMTGGSAIFSQTDNKLYIYGTGTTTLLAITVYGFPKKTGTYALGDADGKNSGTYVDNTNSQDPIFYTTNSGRTGQLVITFFDGKTIKGTFSYTTYNTQKKKEVSVTNGELDVTYSEI
ncbi:DUF6252 family protein [Xanthocytophaga agilis]|uniref:DUF6252 family protein n=1 Tax=Xanthocytophaga agilis TaxID=3048010 RepID=A0AAE3RD26_9BACT|nr:DUF6252 family protein [Xanthocytophaga agilis]MDJ1506335.1 DUF6252 family protein [Xanthocytophaga agilis]